MALSRLLQPKSSLKVHKKGFPKPIRWFCSQSSDAEVEELSQLKKTFVPREQRAVAAETFVKKYMETNQGVFPKASHIQNEVGGSWYIVKAIRDNIKEKLLGTPQLENHHIIDASAPAKETISSAVMTCHSVRDNGNEIHDHSGSVVHAGQVLQTQEKDEIIGCPASTSPEEFSSSLLVDTAASDVTNMHSYSGYCELQAPSTVQSIKSGSDFHASETDASEKVEVNLSTEVVVQLNAVTDNLQLELDSQYIPRKDLVTNMSEASNISEGSNSSHFEHDKLNSTGYGEQQENKTMTRGSVEMSPKFISPDNSPKVSRLADIFKKFTHHAADPEARNGKMDSESSLSDMLLSHGKDRNLQSKNILSTDILLPSGSISKWQDLRINKLVSNGFENQRPQKEMIESILKQNAVPNMAESFTGSGNLLGFGDMKRVNNQASDLIGNTKKDISVLNFFEHLQEPTQKDEVKRAEIKELIKSIKGLPGEPSIARPPENISSCKTDESSKKNQLRTQSQPGLQSFDKKERKMSSDCHAVHRKSKNDDPLAALTGKKVSNDKEHKLFKLEEPDQNKAVVKFLLRTAPKIEIIYAFRHCGDILKVEILSSEKDFYKIASIYFKTKAGLQNALEKTDVMVRSANITVEAAASGEDISNKTSVPSLIGDPNVPAGLVKNPTRTVKITQLTHDITSHDIVAALASCESNVTGFFLGAFDSVAYVEFETEDGKEMALAKHSIDVLGKQLLISRIDAPRTTVVRISYHHSLEPREVVQACNSIGKTRWVNMRRTGIMDVHFKHAEWPNMLNILNRLNAVQVDGHRLLAQPASVFPPDILRILWNQPEERKYVKTVMQNMLQKLGENIVHKVGLTDLADFY